MTEKISGEESFQRRQFLKKSSAYLSAGAAVGLAGPQALASPDRIIGDKSEDVDYGQPSKDAKLKRKLLPGNNYSSSGYSPLGDMFGSITPSGLHFTRHHAGVPQIEMERHRLLIRGPKNKNILFTMSDLMRFPQRTIPAFIECSGNSDACWKESPLQATVDEIHGMSSQSFWTGVPLSYLLSAVDAPKKNAWVIASGMDAASLARSIPIEKCWKNGYVVYGQNGEPLRAEQGYPLRLLLPGWEGNCQIKWLGRLEISDKPAFSYQETAKYSDLYQDGIARLFTFAMDTKSVITSPSSGMTLKQKGFCEIRGLAWSGRGKIHSVEVTTDAGKSWVKADLEDPVLPFSHTRFFFPWNWNGEQTLIGSRAIDETGYVQPERKALIAKRGSRSYYHYHGIQYWKLFKSGKVENDYI